MLDYIPYCYLIGWSNLNVWYYGSEYGSRSKVANPNNLWKTYFSSSSHVKKFRQVHGEPDVIQIRKTFSTAEQTILWEYNVLRRIGVRQNNNWLNINEGKGPIGTPWSRKRRKEKSIEMLGRKNPTRGTHRSEETKAKIRAALVGKMSGPNNGMFGKHHTFQSKKKMSKNHARLSGKDNSNFGKKWSEDKKREYSEQRNPHKFLFTHEEHGEVEKTLHEMISTFSDLNKGGLRALYQGRLKQYKGWKHKGE